jgi:dolichol-phosphate mannosyltransferase
MESRSGKIKKGESIPDISVIVAIYNNERTLDNFFENLVDVLTNLCVNYEIMAVLDGPKDSSHTIVKNLANKNDRIRAISLSRNFGQVSAIIAGIEHARGRCMVNISADGQDPTILIKDLYSHFLAGNEIVIAFRISREDSFFTRLTSRIAYFVLRSEQKNIPVGGFDYFLLGSKAYVELIKLKGRFRFLQSDILDLGFDPVFIPYHRNKSLGSSNYTFSKRLKYFENGIVDSSYNPIRFFLYLGALFACLGFSLSIASLISYFMGNFPFRGFSSLFIAIMLIGGLNLFCVAFIGMYVYRIYDFTRGRPTYIRNK